jgi:hypothetical protein
MNGCMFCDEPGKISGEHIFSDWMNNLFPREWEAKRTDRDQHTTLWSPPELNFKANVVCETCNSGWMSALEGEHAKPVMAPLIVGEMNIPIGQQQARSLAIFAFKTALILDQVRKSGDPFFSRRLAFAFKNGFNIPININMWLCAYVPGTSRADYEVAYYSGTVGAGYQVHLYVLTFGIGCLAFQVVAAKQIGTFNIPSPPGFEDLAVPFWPHPPRGFIWPARRRLRSIEEFQKFHRRWGEFKPF